ncbi:MAG TPA: glycine--tRNA ligase [Candidatus Korarchaeota archaeon]|nr:glycine--tRNA ligase [Candidatus Korarchaeota archaeon]
MAGIAGRGTFEKVIELSARRGFFWPSARDLYPQAPAGFWVYGPLGFRLKEKIVQLWREYILRPEGAVELETPLVLPLKVFEASGHLEHFFDKLVECKRCHSRFRIDKLLEESLDIEESLEAATDEELYEMLLRSGIKCPKCGAFNWTEVKKFNLMFTLPVGAEAEEPNAALRPETTQGSVVEYKRTFTVMRGKLPFIMAQRGRVFRNEISPRRALVRMREFQQLEIHVFFDPEDVSVYEDKIKDLVDYKLRFLKQEDKETGRITEMTVSEALESGYTINALITYWLAIYQKFFNEVIGIPLDHLRYRELGEGERAHYASAHWDLEAYTEDLGWIELVNNAYRTDYDLKGHTRASGVDLSVQTPKGKVVPHLYEPSIGLDRTVLHVLMMAYREDEKRRWLKLPRYLAPIEVAVFPLVSKDGLPEVARELAKKLSRRFETYYDEKDSIGRRYRRMDEVGTPACVTVDYQTLEDGTVTLRDRDTMRQVRVPSEGLEETLEKFLSGAPLESLGAPVA